MNQERFDGLTRALADGQVSRGRMLKMVAAATIGGTLGGWDTLLRGEGAAAKEKFKCKSDDDCGRCGRCSDKKTCVNTCVGSCSSCTSLECAERPGQCPGGACAPLPTCVSRVITVDGVEVIRRDCLPPLEGEVCGFNCCTGCDTCKDEANSICESSCKRKPPAEGGNCEFCDANDQCQKLSCPGQLVLDQTGKTCLCGCPIGTQECNPPDPLGETKCCSFERCEQCNPSTGTCDACVGFPANFGCGRTSSGGYTCCNTNVMCGPMCCVGAGEFWCCGNTCSASDTCAGGGPATLLPAYQP